jgi:hypothetical protein
MCRPGADERDGKNGYGDARQARNQDGDVQRTCKRVANRSEDRVCLDLELELAPGGASSSSSSADVDAPRSGCRRADTPFPL